MAKYTISPAIKSNGRYEYLVGYNHFAVDLDDIDVVDIGLKGWRGNCFVNTPLGSGFVDLRADDLARVIYRQVKLGGDVRTCAWTATRGDNLNAEAKTWDKDDEAYGTVYDDSAVYLWASDGAIVECDSPEHLAQHL